MQDAIQVTTVLSTTLRSRAGNNLINNKFSIAKWGNAEKKIEKKITRHEKRREEKRTQVRRREVMRIEEQRKEEK